MDGRISARNTPKMVILLRTLLPRMLRSRVWWKCLLNRFSTAEPQPFFFDFQPHLITKENTDGS